MNALLRRLLAIVGPMVTGVAIGGGFDRAGVTPAYDSDLTLRGLVAGVGLGLLAMAFVTGDGDA